MHVTAELIARIARFSADFHAARMSAAAMLPGNPFGVEVRIFGEGVAVKVQHPLLRGKNRVVGFQPGDLELLDDLISFYRADGLHFTLTVPPGQMTFALFQRLVQAGLWSEGSGTVPALLPSASPIVSEAPAGIVIRRSELQEKELYLDLFQQAFAGCDECDPRYRAFQWAEDALPGGVRYVAEIDGQPVGMASFSCLNGVGFCGTAGVVPEYRKRGVQRALIQRRIADAPDLGCDLILEAAAPAQLPTRTSSEPACALFLLGQRGRKRHEVYKIRRKL